MIEATGNTQKSTIGFGMSGAKLETARKVAASDVSQEKIEELTNNVKSMLGIETFLNNNRSAKVTPKE